MVETVLDDDINVRLANVGFMKKATEREALNLFESFDNMLIGAAVMGMPINLRAWAASQLGSIIVDEVQSHEHSGTATTQQHTTHPDLHNAGPMPGTRYQRGLASGQGITGQPKYGPNMHKHAEREDDAHFKRGVKSDSNRPVTSTNYNNPEAQAAAPGSALSSALHGAGVAAAGLTPGAIPPSKNRHSFWNGAAHAKQPGSSSWEQSAKTALQETPYASAVNWKMSSPELAAANALSLDAMWGGSAGAGATNPSPLHSLSLLAKGIDVIGRHEAYKGLRWAEQAFVIDPAKSVFHLFNGMGHIMNDHQLQSNMAHGLMWDPSLAVYAQNDLTSPVRVKEIWGGALNLGLLLGGGYAAGAALDMARPLFASALDAGVGLFVRDGAEKVLSPEELLNNALNNSKVSQQLEQIHISSSNSAEALRNKLSALIKAQDIAEKAETTPEGLIKYYRKFRNARTPGSTSGARFVTEYDPKTGRLTEWNETYNQQGEVNRIHLKNINGIQINSPHFPPILREILDKDFTSNISPKGGF